MQACDLKLNQNLTLECLHLPQVLWRCLLQGPPVSSKLKIRSSEILLAQFTVRSEPWFTSSGSKNWFTINLVHVHIVHRKGAGGPCPSSTPLAPLFMGISLLLRPLFTSWAQNGFSLNCIPKYPLWSPKYDPPWSPRYDPLWPPRAITQLRLLWTSQFVSLFTHLDSACFQFIWNTAIYSNNFNHWIPLFL